MAKPGRGARMKGANFERHIAKLLTQATGVKFERGLGQTRRGGAEVPDIFSELSPRWHFELKRQKACSIKAAMRQADGDIEGKKDKTAIVITKDDRGPTLVTMHYDDWIELFKSHV